MARRAAGPMTPAVVISRHGMRRVRKRFRIPARGVTRLACLALRAGLGENPAELCPSLRRYVEGLIGPHGSSSVDFVRIYRGAVFLFGLGPETDTATLVTAWPLPESVRIA